MITELIIGAIIDVFAGLFASVMEMVGLPASGNLLIPAPLLQIVDVIVTAITAMYPAALVWYIWRQVKA